MDQRTRVPRSCWSDARSVSEAVLVQRLVSGFARASLLDLIDEYLSSHRLPATILDSCREYAQEAVKREEWTVRYMGFCLRRYADRSVGGRLVLDAGCGSGGSLPHVAARAERVIGLDVDLPSLILSAKRCDDLGIRDRVTLVAARLEDPVIVPDALDQIKCTDVIEHVENVEEACRQLTASLAPGGASFVLTPNKWSLWNPEPHVRLWGVQFLPARVADWYVKRRIGIPYGTVAHLMGYGRFMKVLRRSGSVNVVFIPVEDKYLNPDSVRGRTAKRALAGWPLAALSFAARPLQPSLEALCIKTAVS